MEWFRVDVAFILSAEFLALPEAPRAHWLSLAAYCSQQENGGVMKGAAKWKDREWSFSAGLRLRSVQKLLELGLLKLGSTVSDPSLDPVSTESGPSLDQGRGLCSDDYVLASYDVDGEQRLKRTSETNSNNAKRRWRRDATADSAADAKRDVRNAHTDPTRRDETDNILPLALVHPDAPRARFDFEAVYRDYPRHEGKKKGLLLCEREVRTPADFEDLVRAVANYKAIASPGYEKHFSTFMGCWRDYVEAPKPRAPLTREEQAELDRAQRVNGVNP
jgi:hypothetical protein